MFNRLPGLARLLLALTAINLVVFAAFRGIFWAAFHEALANASWADLLKALYLGSKFDLRLALLVCLPLALLGWISLFDPARRRASRIAWLAYLALAQCMVLLLYFVDFGHYAYARVRLNASLIDHLTPVSVAARVAWETYPVLSGVLGLALLTSACSQSGFDRPSSTPRRSETWPQIRARSTRRRSRQLSFARSTARSARSWPASTSSGTRHPPAPAAGSSSRCASTASPASRRRVT